MYITRKLANMYKIIYVQSNELLLQMPKTFSSEIPLVSQKLFIFMFWEILKADLLTSDQVICKLFVQQKIDNINCILCIPICVKIPTLMNAFIKRFTVANAGRNACHAASKSWSLYAPTLIY